MAIEPQTMPEYVDVADAPIVYFDIIAAHGALNGTIQVELASRTMAPVRNSANVTVRFVTTGRLRCSPAAAVRLRDAIDQALKLLQQATSQPAYQPAAAKPN